MCRGKMCYYKKQIMEDLEKELIEFLKHIKEFHTDQLASLE